MLTSELVDTFSKDSISLLKEHFTSLISFSIEVLYLALKLHSKKQRGDTQPDLIAGFRGTTHLHCFIEAFSGSFVIMHVEEISSYAEMSLLRPALMINQCLLYFLSTLTQFIV